MASIKTDSNDEYYYKNEGEIVLGVYLHCEACVTSVLKALRGVDGVEGVEPNMEENRVIVKGKACDPDIIASRVRRKLGKSVTIISPAPIKKQVKKEEPPKVTETVLKMHLHCEECAKDVKRRILTMKGVQSAKPDMDASTVSVKGTVDPKDIIELIYKKTGKRAEVVIPKKEKDQNQNQNQNQNDGKEKGGKKKEKGQNQNQNDGVGKDSEKDWRTVGLSYPNDPRGFEYATEMFSDENTESCSIM